MKTKIGKEKVDAQEFTIEIDDNGEFYAEFDGDEVKAETKKKLIEKLRQAVRTHKRVEVQATMIEDSSWSRREGKAPDVTPIVLTGIHGSNRNVLYRVDKKNGVNGQLSRSEDVLRRLTPGVVENFMELWRAMREAEKAFDKFKKTRVMDPHDAVEKAAAAVMKGSGADA